MVEPVESSGSAVYHRRKSSSQDDDTARLIETSGELWGKGAWPSGLPCAKAYLGPLPAGVAGIEFTSPIPPHPTGHPFEARWYVTTPGVGTRYVDGYEFAVVPVTVTRNTQC